MKRWFHIAFLSCVLAFSAYNRPVETQNFASLPHIDPALQAIDSLMWQRPDSALAVLLDYFARRDALNASPDDVSPKNDINDSIPRRNHCVSTAYDRHYAHLLLAELLYKNDYAQTNCAELRQAVAYYDSLTIALNDAPNPSDSLFFLAARAHYINGVGHYEADSLVEACTEYLKALETMEGHFAEKALVGKKAKFMTYTYNRLGDMFEEQLLADLAIVCYKQSLVFCRKDPTSIYGLSKALYSIGIQFDVSGQSDSALYYYNEALANLPDNDNIHYRDIMVTKAVFAYNHMDISPDSIIGDLERLASLSSTESERITRFLTIGNVLYEDKRYDSSLPYLTAVFNQQEDVQSRILAAENLYNIFQTKGDAEQASKYAAFLAEYTMTEIEKKNVTAQINEMVQDYLRQKREAQSKDEREKAVRKAIGVVAPIAVLVALVLFVLVKHRSKHLLRQQRGRMEQEHKKELQLLQEKADKTLESTMQRQEMELREHQEEARNVQKRHEEELESVRLAHEMEQEALRQSLLKQEEQVDILEKALAQQREDAELRREAFLNEDICRKINDSIRNIHITAREGTRANVVLSTEDALSLREAVLRHYANFESVLLSKNPKMSQGDLQLCQLYLLGLDERQMAVLLCKTYSAIKKRANVLKEFLGITDTLSAYILKFPTCHTAKEGE